MSEGGELSLPLTQHFPNIVWEFAVAASSLPKHLKFVPTSAYPLQLAIASTAALVDPGPTLRGLSG